MASLLPLSPYNPAAESWDSYLARFDCYLEANAFTDVTDNRKRALFLSLCGFDVFETARNLVAPLAVQTTPWDVLQGKLKAHYAPKPSKIASRHAFHHRNQAEGESINTYVAALRKAALHCEFRDLDDALLDRIVCGVRDEKLQRRLLAKADLTLQQAIAEAQAAEVAKLSAQEIRRANSPPMPRKPSSVHHGDISGSESSASEEEEVCRVKTAQGRGKRDAKVQSVCAGCGGSHTRSSCNFKDAICRRCSKKGHLARVCRSSKPPDMPPSARHKKGSPRPANEDCYAVSKCRCSREAATMIGQADVPSARKLHVTVQIEGAHCTMEIDTGSAMSIVSWSTIKRLVPRLSKRQLDPHHIHLRDYQGNSIPVVGIGRFRVTFKGFNGLLRLVIVEGPRPSLLGLEWFAPLGLEVTGVHSISDPDVEGLLNEFPEVFDGTLGQYTGTPISFNLDPLIAPIRLKPRRVPFALKSKVDEQIDKLIAQGVLEPVDHAKWETPIVTPIKPDGSVRICADYKCTINKALQHHAYPVPVVSHLLHSLGEGKVFAKLDLAQAYQQLPVDDATAEAQTIVTHRGAFRCRRLQFGVSVAPGIFQSLMERLLQGIPGVVPYFDDVLVSAVSNQQLLERLRAVLTRFQEAGLKVKREKCQIAVPHVEFLGYLVDASGIHPTATKTNAILEAPRPKNKTELQSFLGLLNFYNMFLPHKATVAEPLHRLLDKKASWSWGRRENAAFDAVKGLLSSDSVLVQYNETRPLVLVCDASPFGIGAVLSHRFPNGREAPIAYFSRTLSPTERNYSQLDKEALALVAGVNRFHEYLYGRTFDLVTDHKPLLGLLAGDRPTPQVLSPRMLRWTVFLAAYSYRLLHRPGKSLGHADALSRSPLPTLVEDPAPASSILLIEDLPTAPVSAVNVASFSAKDRIIAQVLNWVWRGWPKGPVDSVFQPFTSRQHELSAHQGCLLWGSRVVVPQKLRQRVLEALHVGHPGIVKMKALARSYVWWPNMDEAITACVESCQACQESRPAPPIARGNSWESPKAPWSRVHIDLAGPFHGRTFMVVVDAYSKWLEVALMPSTTSEAVIRVLRGLFATHGLPDVLVSDNGTQFTSGVFERYLISLGVRHALIAPFHPSSNGQAERMVRSAKEALARMDQGDWHERVNEYLLVQHITPHASTGRSPAELLMGRRLRSTLDRLHPDFAVPEPPGCADAPRTFVPGNRVFARNYTGESAWVPAVVVGVSGPRSYQVALEDGRLWRRHIDQLRRRAGDLETAHDLPTVSPPEPTEAAPRDSGPLQPTPRTADMPRNSDPDSVPPTPVAGFPEEPVATASSRAAEPGRESADCSEAQTTPNPNEDPGGQATPGTGLRRSGRAHKRPAYLKDYVQ